MRPQCDLIALKNDNRKEVTKVSERFYSSRRKISECSRNQISRELYFEHAQKTGRDRFGHSEVLLVSERYQSRLIFIADRLQSSCFDR